MFPNACYIGFTGTPLLKTREERRDAQFGGLIHTYTIHQAVEDGPSCRCSTRGGMVEHRAEQGGHRYLVRAPHPRADREQKADLKKKYARAEMLNKAEQVIYMRAFDISEHYRQNWQGTGFKAQLVAPSKAAALKYKKYLDEIGDGDLRGHHLRARRRAKATTRSTTTNPPTKWWPSGRR